MDHNEEAGGGVGMVSAGVGMIGCVAITEVGVAIVPVEVAMVPVGVAMVALQAWEQQACTSWQGTMKSCIKRSSLETAFQFAVRQEGTHAAGPLERLMHRKEIMEHKAHAWKPHGKEVRGAGMHKTNTQATQKAHELMACTRAVPAASLAVHARAGYAQEKDARACPSSACQSRACMRKGCQGMLKQCMPAEQCMPEQGMLHAKHTFA
eukprot:1159790-Pelagomonas_calceolata.AAC.4